MKINRALVTERVAETLFEQLELDTAGDSRLFVFCCVLVKAEVVSLSALEEIYCRCMGVSAAEHISRQIEYALEQFEPFTLESRHDPV